MLVKIYKEMLITRLTFSGHTLTTWKMHLHTSDGRDILGLYGKMGEYNGWFDHMKEQSHIVSLSHIKSLSHLEYKFYAYHIY